MTDETQQELGRVYREQQEAVSKLLTIRSRRVELHEQARILLAQLREVEKEFDQAADELSAKSRAIDAAEVCYEAEKVENDTRPRPRKRRR